MGARNAIPKEEYGLVMANGRCQKAHRISFQLTKGKIPKDAWVLHRCDNPPCIRPSHLFLGNAKKNAIDRNSKGRLIYATGDDHWTHKKPERVARGKYSGRYTKPERTARGERHGCAKLRSKDVSWIRSQYLTGLVSCANLAKEFSVRPTTIQSIINGKTWALELDERTKKRLLEIKRLRINQLLR